MSLKICYENIINFSHFFFFLNLTPYLSQRVDSCFEKCKYNAEKKFADYKSLVGFMDLIMGFFFFFFLNEYAETSAITQNVMLIIIH